MNGKLADKKLARAYERALALEKSGKIDAAVAAYEKVLALDPKDHGGVAVRLAAMGRGPQPQKAPDAYVETLFSQHAEDFEAILVDQLGYGVPTLIRERVVALGLGPFASALDMGCGTGLVGEALREFCGALTGFDLAEPMVEIAYDKQIYDSLYVAGLDDYIKENDEAPFDLIVAADVLPYLGALEGFFAGAAANLNSKGILIFSTERLDAGEEYRVGPNQRFLHGRAYIEAGLAIAFEQIECQAINVRNQDGAPSPGDLVIARKL